MVFVLDANKTPLAPCHPARARQLLKENKAAIYRKMPFTIIFKKEVTAPQEQDFRLKIDYGSKHTGLAILRNENVVWLGQLDHRTNIKSNLDKRRGYRRRRRSKNLRYRQPRFLNRTRPKGWVPPSLQSRVDNILHWVSRLRRLAPIGFISYENVKFDTQLMQNTEIGGMEYQQGELAGYEVREYLLEKFSRKCVYCKVENVPLEVEHIVPKARGGSNRLTASDCVNAQPTVDAVPVVRCRDCVYAHLTMSGQVKRCEKRVDDDGFMVEEYRESSFYCADGKRKEATDGRSD